MFNTNKIDEAHRLVMDFHYSRRWPSCIKVCATLHTEGGLFGDCGHAVAACIFSFPTARWNQPALELSRLVRSDEYTGPLTPLISWASKKAKQSGASLLISYAAQKQRHHGGIYQSASWNYHGMRQRTLEGILIDGLFIPARTCNVIYGTKSPIRLRVIMPGRAIEPSYDEGKHLYWRALNRQGMRSAKALGLECNAYPKPDAILQNDYVPRETRE